MLKTEMILLILFLYKLSPKQLKKKNTFSVFTKLM
jgi:hypothetical protein